MGLFNNVGGIGKTEGGFNINKTEKDYEVKNIGIISFKFEKPSAQVERAIEVFGEDADYAMEFNHLASNFDPEANLL